jgi:hypothetical protein
MKFCEQCGNRNDQSARFCRTCGGHLSEKEPFPCPSCGTENKDSAKFCKYCGTSFTKKEEKPESKAPESKPETPRLTREEPPKKEESAPAFAGEPIKLRPGMRILNIEETGEIMEEIEERGDNEGLHVLSGTFAETLDQLAQSREELARIEERIGEALKVQRNREEEKLREMTAVYELTQKKIEALEELSALRRLQTGEVKLARLFRGEIPDIEGNLFDGEKEEELEDELEDIEDLEDLDDLEDFRGSGDLGDLEDLDDLDDLEDLEDLD